jgi:hypothetical protein
MSDVRLPPTTPIQAEEEPMSQNGTHTTTQDAVARAMEASRRLLDAAAKARDACLEACQETVRGIPGVQQTIDAVAPVDWTLFASQPGFPGSKLLGEQWQEGLGGPLDADELVAAAKRVCLEYVDSYEQAVLAAIDLSERLTEATNLDCLRSVASTGFAAERDVTKAYMSTIRGCLE